MPTDIAEDTIDLTIDLLEAITPETGDESYPFPRLKTTGRSELRQFRVVVLENAYLQVTVVPDLGGRILRIYDKRTSKDIVPYTPRIAVAEGGTRGVTSTNGVQFALNGVERPNAMGTVAHMPDFSEEEDEPGGLWLGEICGNGLSFNCRIVLPPERAEILMEFRLLNRSLESVPVNPGLLFGSEFAMTWFKGAFHGQSSEGTGLRIEADTPLHQGKNGLFRFRQTSSLAPRQLDSWTATLTPFSLPGKLSGMSREASASFDDERLAIQSTEQRLGHKVVLLTQEGQALEAVTDLYPETLYEAGLPSAIKDLAILDPNGKDVLLIGSTKPAPNSSDPDPLQVEWPSLDWDEARLRQATFNVAQRHLAHLLLGYRFLAASEYAAADREFEQALLFNAEDHLTWWIKAVTARLMGEVGEERAELLNAHFLAPLEPALRAESYLGSPSQTKEPSAVLRPLDETPAVYVEVAAMLLEAGLYTETSKWIDEALRHNDLPMLRYLLAYAYLSASRMEVEAAEQIAAAGQRPAAPPYAYRPIEIEALSALRERFPDNQVLGQYAALAGYLPV